MRAPQLWIGLALILVIWPLNWGLEGLGKFAGGDWNVVRLVLGGIPNLEWAVYVLVGLAAVYELVVHKKNCRMCGNSGGMM